MRFGYIFFMHTEICYATRTPLALTYAIQIQNNDHKCAALAPHELVHNLWKAGPKAFAKSLLGPDGPSGVSSWWAAASQDPAYRHHHMMQTPWLMALMLPILIFVDGGEIFSNSEFLTFLWCCALATGEAIDVKFPIICVRSMHLTKHTTKIAFLRDMCRFINWSLSCLEVGVGPERGFHGEYFEPDEIRSGLSKQPLAGKWRGCFAGLKTDGKARRETNLFLQHAQATFICDSCYAIQEFKHAPEVLNYTDFSEDAFWAETCFGTEHYLDVTPLHQRSPWCQVRGWALELNIPDGMHNDYLGIARDLGASVIFAWLLAGLLGALTRDNADSLLTGLTIRMFDWCKQRKIKKPFGKWFSIASLGRETLYEKKFPILHSSFRAASNKVICVFLGHMASKLHPTSNRDKLACTCILAYTDYHYVLDHEERLWSDSGRERAFHAAQLFLSCYQALAAHSSEDDSYLWKLRPKFHYFDHDRRRRRNARFNPRYFTNFGEESMMGVIKAIGKKCHGTSASRRILQRYLLLHARRLKQIESHTHFTKRSYTTQNTQF